MLIVNECRSFLDALDVKYPMRPAYVCLPVPESHTSSDVEVFLKEVRGMGYAAYMRTSEFGDEVVITESVNRT